MPNNSYFQLERNFFYFTINFALHLDDVKITRDLNIYINRIGQETLMDENLPDDKIEIELAPIAVQLAYVQQVTSII